MDAGGRIGISDLLKQLVRPRLPVTTDQPLIPLRAAVRACKSATTGPARVGIRLFTDQKVGDSSPFRVCDFYLGQSHFSTVRTGSAYRGLRCRAVDAAGSSMPSIAASASVSLRRDSHRFLSAEPMYWKISAALS